MVVRDVLEAVANKAMASSVQTVFGEPQEVHGRTIIPVARVAFGFGGGGGGGEAPPEEAGRAGVGGGGGGGGSAVPVAVVEVSEEGLEIRPIVDVTRTRLAALACVGMALWVLGRYLGRR